MASLRKSHKARVKPMSYLCWIQAYSWGLRLPSCLVFTLANDVAVAMVPCVIIMATSTPSLHSLGLGADRRVVPYGRFAYLGLV